MDSKDSNHPDQASSPVRTRADMSMNMLTGNAPPRTNEQPHYQSSHPQPSGGQGQETNRWPPDHSSHQQPNYYPPGGQQSPTSGHSSHFSQPSPPQTQHNQPRVSQSHVIPNSTNSQQGTPSQASSAGYQQHNSPQQHGPGTPGQVSGNTPTHSGSNQIPPGGAPARQYINENVTPYLLEGMKMLVREQPNDPLKVLGEWLIEQSARINGNSNA